MIKVVQIGCGKMSAYTMRYVYEKGSQIVGAFDVNESIIGKDIGTIIGGENKGVIVNNINVLDEKLKEIKPDIAIITTQSLISSIYPLIEILAKNHVNVVSICEELFYGWASNPIVSEKIDKIAKEYGVTVTGSGYQDVSWGSMVSALAATAASIKTIKGISSYNLEDYGLETAAMHGAGLTNEEFNEQILTVNNVSDEKAKELISKGEFLPGYMWPVNGWVASDLNLHPTKIYQTGEPTTYKTDLFSKTLNKTIKAGDPTGLKTIVTTETEEGITIITECLGYVFSQEETDINEWLIEGEPNMKFTMASPATVEMTCACAVNRLPDVVKANPGYITSDHLEALSYKNNL